MPIFDIFKKKKPSSIKTTEGKEKKKEKKEKKDKMERAKKAEKPKEEVGKKIEEKVIEKPKKKEVKVAPLVLRSAHIAEKPTRLAEINQYVFKVYPSSSKTEIKRAIEEVYGVDVLKVRVIKIPRKRRRLGRMRGWRKGYKKAIVKIKEGQKIEILPR